MIKHLLIENFRCLRKVEFDLEPLTVLVGPNGSGKSSLLKALVSWGRTQFGLEDCWKTVHTNAIKIDIVRHDGERIGGIFRQGTLLPKPLGDYQVLQLDLDLLRSDNPVEAARRLNDVGGNLANVFSSMGRAIEERAARQFSALVPLFGDVNVKPTGGGRHGFFFADRWTPGIEYRPRDVSDGTMLVLAYVTLLHQRDVPDLLAIEEPERGLHPYLIRELIALLRKLTTGELGAKPIQVLLATHSAELLNFVQPNEVRFFSRSKEDGGVVVKPAPLDSPNWAKACAEYGDSMGDLWLSGNLGGVPGA